MSVNTVNSKTNNSGIDQIVKRAMTALDTDGDGKLSSAEFGNFLTKMLDTFSSTPGKATTKATANADTSADTAPAPGPSPVFAGFDASRLQSAGDSLKYFAMKVLMKYDPNDGDAMNKAYAELNASKPGQYELDPQGNLMLSGTADGYIGARPLNWGAGGTWYDRGQGTYQWQWLAYNTAHKGPNGETA